MAEPALTLNQKILKYLSHHKPGSRAVVFVDDFGQSFKTCASLPQRALKAAGAKTNFDDGGGTDYVWGEEVALDALQPGDILQFKNHYQMMDNRAVQDRAPFHSAIVVSVDAQRRFVEVVEQHIKPDPDRIIKSTIYLGCVADGIAVTHPHQCSGTIKGYRAVPADR